MIIMFVLVLFGGGTHVVDPFIYHSETDCNDSAVKINDTAKETIGVTREWICSPILIKVVGATDK